MFGLKEATLQVTSIEREKIEQKESGIEQGKTDLRNDSFYGTSDTKCLFLMKVDLFGKSE